MQYFFDTEFIEDGKTIDLVSIGMVCSDGREYYAISTEFDSTKADGWVKRNVLDKLESDPHYYKPRNQIRDEILDFVDEKPEFWAYYADYDWVVFCQLFGRMIDLPKHFPMFCMDLKQLLFMLDNPKVPKLDEDVAHNALTDAKWVRDTYHNLLL